MDIADEEQLTALYRDHADAVYQYAAQRVGAHEAGEVVSDTFVVAWRKFGAIPAGSERAWLFGVARRETLNRLRSSSRRESLYARLLSSASDTERDIADGVAVRLDVWQALAALREADRDLLLTTLWTDLSAAEAARTLGYTRATYAVRLHRARRRFARVLSAEQSSAIHAAQLRSA
ncbi:RNA polymerase sigma factor [Actinoplanes sp. NPDC051859]|uniref:RNA polymerase sigma factor n=1 Tax=Actinoplanes sp. NPDC051859 TaxID=3363909 RepID=UPI0037B62D13